MFDSSLPAPETLPGRDTPTLNGRCDDDERLAALFALIPDGVVIIDPETALPLQFNPAAHHQLGYSAEEFASLRISDYEAIETPQQTQAHIEKIYRCGQDVFETRQRRKDGTLMDVHVSTLMMKVRGKPFILCIFRDISAQKQAEAAMMATQNQLEATLDAIPDLLFELGLDGTYHDIHAQSSALLAAPADELLYRKVSDMLPPEAAGIVMQALQEAHETGHSHGRQFELPVPQGNLCFELSVARKPTGPDSMPRFVVLSRDITARSHMEQALRTSAEHLEEAQRLAQMGSWELNLASGELNWSDEIFRLFELDKQHFGATYEAFLNAIHPDDRDSVNLAYTHSLETRTPYEITHRLRMPDGRIKWVHERCTSDFDSSGKPLRSAGTVQDVTASMLAQEALRQSKEQYEELTERIPVGVYTFRIRTDGSMAFDYVSPRFCQLLGLSAQEVLADSTTAFACAHPEERDEFIRLNQEAGRTLQPFVWEGRFVIHGETRWFLIESAPTLLENGDSLWNGVISDISERKRAEFALNQLNDQLEQRVAERTADLRRAKEEAERANSAKSEFLSRMSHELRTPMNAILGFGQLLESDTQHPLSPDQQENIHEILHAGSHLLELINEVLDLARIESGRLEIAPEAVSIGPLVDECAALVQPLAIRRSISLNIDTDGICNNQAVLADHLRLRQILLNLLSNAIKYNHEGGNVAISCHPAMDGAVRITVSDNGRGIPAEEQDRLFKPFERIETAYEGIEGTGIGLALSKRLIESMNGTIGVKSAAGTGSTFWIEIPCADTTTTITQPDTATESGACATARTLLYIEDNPANLRLVKKIISTHKGLALLDAHTAELGLEIARAYQPELILLDINLPGMDGHEALRHLQNDPATSHIPVVAITANTMERDIRKGLDAGFVAYLTKPLQITDFLTLLNELLEPASAQEP